MNDQQLDQFLRENRPVPSDDPTFLLEVSQKMRAVEGIKDEVDRQRSQGRRLLVVTLITGIVVGVLFTCFAFFFPIKPAPLDSGWLARLQAFAVQWKLAFPLLIAACAISLGLLAPRRTRRSSFLQ